MKTANITVRLTFIESVLGTSPTNEEIYRGEYGDRRARLLQSQKIGIIRAPCGRGETPLHTHKQKNTLIYIISYYLIYCNRYEAISRISPLSPRQSPEFPP